MSVQSFTVGGVQYNAAMASAVDQDVLLSLLSGALVERWVRAAAAGQDPDSNLVVMLFMNMAQPVKKQCAELLMRQVFVNGTQVPISAADFAGRMVHYNQLLAELLRWNLGDFFEWLPAEIESARQRVAAEEDPAL